MKREKEGDGKEEDGKGREGDGKREGGGWKGTEHGGWKGRTLEKEGDGNGRKDLDSKT